jgi:hypothetical protein
VRAHSDRPKKRWALAWLAQRLPDHPQIDGSSLHQDFISQKSALGGHPIKRPVERLRTVPDTAGHHHRRKPLRGNHRKDASHEHR